jgi:hypothetical protein
MPDEPSIRRLLAVCLEEDGSLPELEPAMQLLKRGLPGARLTLLALSPAPPSEAKPSAAGPGTALSHVEEILDYPARSEPDALVDLISAVRRRRFDAALIFTQAGSSPYLGAYLCYLAGVRLRLGQSCEFGGAVLSHRFLPPPDSGLARQQYLALAGRALDALAPADAGESE